METDDRIEYAIEHTEVIRPPEQRLATFGGTNIYYYLITGLMDNVNVIREGRVIAARPRKSLRHHLGKPSGLLAKSLQINQVSRSNNLWPGSNDPALPNHINVVHKSRN